MRNRMSDSVDVSAKWIKILIGSVVVSSISNIYGNTIWKLVISDNSPLSSVGWMVLGAIIGGVAILALPPVRIATDIRKPTIKYGNIITLFKLILVGIPTMLGAYGSILVTTIVFFEKILSINIDGIPGLVVFMSGLIFAIFVLFERSSFRLGFFFAGIPISCWLSYNILASVINTEPVGGFGLEGGFLLLISPFLLGVIINIVYGFSVLDLND